MSLFETLILAVVQGLTEFLPISSSGHLVIAEALFGGTSESSLGVIIMLHLATAAAAFTFYRHDVLGIARSLLPGSDGADPEVRRGRRILLLVVIASIPTGIVGFTMSSFFESLFGDPGKVAISLFVTGAVLVASSRLPEGRIPAEDLAPWKALVIGTAQAVAIIPGISRSGATITASLFLGLRRTDAVALSFLLLLPATGGAALYEATRVADLGGNLAAAFTGFVAAALVGYASIFLVLRWTKKGKLWYFGLYCWFAAASAAVIAKVG
jgi:undecaprenyl-diphosphatase